MDHLQPADVGQAQVQKGQIDLCSWQLQQVQRLSAGGTRQDIGPQSQALEHPLQLPAENRVVLDDQEVSGLQGGFRRHAAQTLGRKNLVKIHHFVP